MEYRAYSLDFKHKVCRAYINGNSSKQEIQDFYDIRGHSTLLKWLRKLGYLSINSESSFKTLTQVAKTNPETKEIEALKARLLEAELKAEAYKRMIVIAEEKFKIEIEKKSGSK